MNLFAVDIDPVIAANQLCLKHIVKMPTETANMLLFPFAEAGFTLLNSKSGNTIKLSHKNHPCSVWLRKSRNNYYWGVNHLIALLDKYSECYNKRHFASNYLDYILFNIGGLSFNKDELTPFPRCFGPYKEFLESEKDTVLAYRLFYHLDKEPFARWKSVDEIPDWWHIKDSRYVDNSFTDGKYNKL